MSDNLNPQHMPDFQATPILAPDGSTMLNTIATPVRSTEGGGSALPLHQWEPGMVLLDLYEVREVLGIGGFGLVYRVFHRQWKQELAIKSPRRDTLAAVGGTENFEREAETWVGLGLHPHVVNCYYIRNIEGLPCVFMEYIDGGSLAEAINDRSLYSGEPREITARVLDIAIQFAWGLHFAHEQGLIHQDVKPANVMLSRDGMVKVTDFGLSRAQGFGMAPVTPDHIPNGSETLIVEGVGMTPAYAAPEQLNRAPLARRADIWSWAVSLLVAFAGRRSWQSGHEAPAVLQRLAAGTEKNQIPLPDGLVQLLEKCFHPEPEQRPHDLKQVADALADIYCQVTSENYPRHMPEIGRETAERLNNRAVSLLDLGSRYQAETLWNRALRIDPHHLESVYNRGLLLWRSGRLTDVEFLDGVEEAAAFFRGGWLQQYLPAMVHLERGDGNKAEACLEAIPAGEGERDLLRDAHLWCKKSLYQRAQHLVHGAHVTALTFSADLRYLLSGTEDGMLRLWQTHSGTLLCECKAHERTVTALALNHDGTLAISGGRDGTLQYWNVSTREQLGLTAGHSGGVSSLCLSADERLLVSGGQQGDIKLWPAAQPERREPLRAFQAHGEAAVLALGLSRDRLKLLSLGADKHLCQWKVGKTVCLQPHMLPAVPLTTTVRAGDGRTFMLAGYLTEHRTHRFQLWDLDSGHTLRQFEICQVRIDFISLSRDGRWLLTGTREGIVRLWQTWEKRCLRTFTLAEKITTLGLNPDGQYFYAGVAGGELPREEIFAVTQPYRAAMRLSQTGSVEQTFAYQQNYQDYLQKAYQGLYQKDYGEAASCVRWARLQPGYARGAEVMNLWRDLYLKLPKKALRGAWKSPLLTPHTQRIKVLAAGGRDGKGRILSAGAGGRITLWQQHNGEHLPGTFDETGINVPPTAAALSADGELVLTARDGPDPTGKYVTVLWQAESGKRLRALFNSDTVQNPALALALDCDGRFAASAHANRFICFWSLHTGVCLRSFQGHSDTITALLLTPDNRYLISAGRDNTIRLWDIRYNQCAHALSGHSQGVLCLALGGGGRPLLSGGGDQLVKVWDPTTGELQRTLRGHHAPVTALVCTVDGEFALSGARDGDVKLWDTQTGECLHTFKAYDEEVTALTLSRDGAYAFAGYAGGAVTRWFLDWDLNERPPYNWQETIAPFLEAFYTRHLPRKAPLPESAKAEAMHLEAALTPLPHRPAVWTQPQFMALLDTLAHAGYGRLTAAEVEAQLLLLRKQKQQGRWYGKMDTLLSRLGLREG